MVDTMAGIEAELIEADWAARARRRCAASPASARSSCCSPRSTRRAAPAACSRCCPSSRARHTVVVASVTDPALVDASREPRRRSTRSTAPPPPSAACSTASASAPRSAGSARLTVTAAPQDLPPALADRYLELKAQPAGSDAATPRLDGSRRSAVVSRRRCASRPRRTRRGRRSRPHATRARRARACRRGTRRARATPMPILTGHGHGAGVTKPSMRPDTKRKNTRPIATREQRAGVFGERDAARVADPARPTPRRSGGPRRRRRTRT